jgi:hypothetical protein
MIYARRVLGETFASVPRSPILALAVTVAIVAGLACGLLIGGST